jgi:hypothetical protein
MPSPGGRDISSIADCESVDPCDDFRFGTGIVEPVIGASCSFG